MGINITQFFQDATPSTYNASMVELGENAARITWANAIQRSAYDSMLLDTPDKLDAMRKWAIGTGAWSAREVDNMTPIELNALFIQLVSGDIREMGGMSWEEYQAAADAGTVSGALFEGIDGGICYTLEG